MSRLSREAVSSAETGFVVDLDYGTVMVEMASIPPKVRAALAAEDKILADALAKLANALAGDERRVRSGVYHTSFHDIIKQTLSGDQIAIVYSRTPYANILEYGGDVPAHIVEPNNAKALMFSVMLGKVFSEIVHSPGFKIKSKPVLHEAFDRMHGQILDGLVRAGTGVVPLNIGLD